MKAKICVLLLIVLCLILSCTNAFGTINISAEADFRNLCRKENVAVQKYNDLLKEWSEDKVNYGDRDAEYPANYGGSYINENKELVIQLTSIDENTESYYSQIIDLENVKFKAVEHSIYELWNIKDNILKTVEIGEGTGIAGVGIATKDNSVAVYTVESDTAVSANTEAKEVEKIDRISKVVEHISVDGYDSVCAAVYPGSKINASDGSRSVGFWAKDSNGNLGIVTAPHSTLSAGTIINIGGTTFGTAQTPAFSGNTDAVFVKRTNTSFSPSRYIPGWDCSIRSYSYISVPVGATIRSKGATSGCQSGVVTDINYTTSYGIGDTILSTASSVGGDSGGIVINDGELDCLVGIITGSQGGTGYQICVKAKNILERLNVSVY